MKDLTVIYYTANTIREPFGGRVRDTLLKAVNGFPLISVSQKPMAFGYNICLGDIGRCIQNIYQQILIGARAASTKFVALTEDDVLYPREHFTEFRPHPDVIGFNMARWGIFTWKKPVMYGLMMRRTNTTMIAPRELLIESLEERFELSRNGCKDKRLFSEPTRYDRKIGATPRKAVDFQSTTPVVVFSHPDALGYENQGNKKRLGFIRAYDIPHWGRAEDVVKLY